MPGFLPAPTEVAVFAGALDPGGIKAADAAEGFGGEDDAAAVEKVGVFGILVPAGGGEGDDFLSGGGEPIVEEEVVDGAAESGLGVPGEGRGIGAEDVLVRAAVVVSAEVIAAAGLFESALARGGQAAVGKAEQADGEFFGLSGDEGGEVEIAAIVEEEEFEGIVREVDGGPRFEEIGNLVGPIISGDDDGEEGGGGCGSGSEGHGRGRR